MWRAREPSIRAERITVGRRDTCVGMNLWRAAWLLVALAATAAWPPKGAQCVDYEPISLTCLAAASDTILLGNVRRDAAGAHRVEVKRVVAGERLEGLLRFETSPWQGAAAQHPGGEALLLLRRRALGTGLEVVGPSAEGWLPVERGYVQTARIRLAGPPDEAAVNPKQQELEVLLQALRGLAECVRWDRTTGHGRVRATILCTEEILDSHRRRSALARVLIAEAKRAATAEGIPCLAIAFPPRSR